jgi:hypothetical protein
MHLMRTPLLAAIICLAVGCSKGTGMQSAAEMQRSLDEAISPGTSLSKAESILKSRGFTVSHVAPTTWPSTRSTPAIGGALTEGNIVNPDWRVAVYAKRGTVTRLEVRTWLTGP